MFKETRADGINKKKAFNPSNMYLLMREKNKDLLNYKQQDAHEFWLRLMTAMDDESNCSNMFAKLFEHVVVTSVKCPKCKKNSQTKQVYKGHVIDIHGWQTISDAINSYFATEMVGSFYCDNCNEKHENGVTKNFVMESTPKILYLMLNRFRNGTHKIKDVIALNTQIQLQVSTSNNPKKYQLASIINHIGSNLVGGHYTAVVRSPSNTFYEFDDTRVHKIDCPVGSNAYILMYELSEVLFFCFFSNHLDKFYYLTERQII